MLSSISHFKRPIRVLVALTLALIFAFSSTILAFAQASLTQISSDPFTNKTSNHKTEVEPDTFAFGSTIVSAFQQGRFFNGGGSDIGFATSTDGGHTWVHGSLPGVTPFSPTTQGPYGRASDASVAFDAKHNVWIISFLGLFPNGNTSVVDVLASRSTNGGLTWSNPVPISVNTGFNDKNWTVCDDTASSPFFGNCYTEFDKFSQLNLFQMSTSTDGGLTWVTKTNPDHTCVIAGQPVVQPNGKVIVPIDDCLETSILSITSTDGGNTWSNPVLAAQILNDGHPGNIRSPDLPSAEIDSSGKVYVVWTDCRTENFCNSGNNDLLLITSSNGTTWSAPTRIPTSAVGSGVDILIPGLAVDRNTSGSSAHLAVVYYTFPSIFCNATGTRNTPACQLNVGFTSPSTVGPIGVSRCNWRDQ